MARMVPYGLAWLTDGEASGMVKAPNLEAVTGGLFPSQGITEILSAHTAIFHAPAGSVSGGRRVYVGRARLPVSARTGGHRGPGRVVALPFFI